MWFQKRRIYLDYAAATPVLPQALRAMNHAEEMFANPGSIHKNGVAAMQVLERAREGIARELNCKARQVIFTSGLTESNNLAILGFARKLMMRQGRALPQTHWITSSIEHSSVLECFGEIERLGGVVTFVDPDTRGIILFETLKNALRPNTVFVSIGWANNEIGVVQKMSELSRTIHGYKEDIVFHSDAGQAPLCIAPHVHTLGVDMLSLGSGKLYGPHGIGALYVREPERLAPIILGGGQEKGLRSGTEKPAAAAGFAKAFEIISGERKSEAIRLEGMRGEFARELAAQFPSVVINGDLRHVLPHMLNISVPGDRSGEYLALQLDAAGISVSTKSACDEGQKDSHVVAALVEASSASPSEAFAKEGRATNTLRFSLGRDTDAADLRQTLETLKNILQFDT